MIISLRTPMRVAAAVLMHVGMFQFAQPYLLPKQIEVYAENGLFTDTLPDGSVVTLQQYARLSYPETFFLGDREVEMSGEVYFDVEHNKQKLFRIATQQSMVEVLGTSFSVRDSQDVVKVAVETGLVRFTSTLDHAQENHKIVIPAGECAALSHSADMPFQTSALNSDEFFWMNDRLVFRTEKLNDVFSTLEDRFRQSCIA